DGTQVVSAHLLDRPGTALLVSKMRSHQRMMCKIAVLVGLWLSGLAGGTSRARAQERSGTDDPAGIEFFETAIRPVLADRCFQCHGSSVEEPKGGLVLETREGILNGGDSGPVIVPGDPEASLLIKAIRYRDKALRMPPKGRLAPAQVSAFETW